MSKKIEVDAGSITIVERGDDGIDVQVSVNGVEFIVAIDVFGEEKTMAQVLVYSDEKNHDEQKVAIRPFADGKMEVCTAAEFVEHTGMDDAEPSRWMKERDGQ